MMVADLHPSASQSRLQTGVACNHVCMQDRRGVTLPIAVKTALRTDCAFSSSHSSISVESTQPLTWAERGRGTGALISGIGSQECDVMSIGYT
jgi:hypothetical protein